MSPRHVGVVQARFPPSPPADLVAAGPKLAEIQVPSDCLLLPFTPLDGEPQLAPPVP